jgi:adenine-specific DNA-methyltransferase
MRERLKILHRLLKSDGVIFVQIDDRYFAHLRLLLDEIFGSNRYINTIAVKTKESSGASGGGEDRRLKKNIEFIIAFGGRDFLSFNDVYNEVPIETYLEQMKIEDKSFKYTSVLTNSGKREFVKIIKDGSGNDMSLFKVTEYETKSLSRLAKEEGLSEIDIIYKYYDRIHTTENAQTSIRTRVQDATDSDDTMYLLQYYPVSGRNKGQLTDILFVGPQKRLVSWFKNVTFKKGNKILKKEKLGTFWSDLNWNNVTREGGVRFPNGQKPEKLISICLELSTQRGDIVLDSFLGSGTTAAVAHKMGRRYIGIELRDQAKTHCFPRLKAVVDGEQGGISKAINWQGGGGFKFYTLAPSLLNQDKFGNWVINKEYNAQMLAAAMAKQEGFQYKPSSDVYWKQGHSSEQDFIFTTTQFITLESLEQVRSEMKEGESLLICCKAYQQECKNKYANVTIKKIPQMLLGRCEYGKEDYSLNIVNLPIEEEQETEEDIISVQEILDNNITKQSTSQQSLF